MLRHENNNILRTSRKKIKHKTKTQIQQNNGKTNLKKTIKQGNHINQEHPSI